MIENIEVKTYTISIEMYEENPKIELFLDAESATPIMKIEISSQGGGPEYPMYSGSYEVIPTDYDQYLYTKQKSMTKNVTISEVPFHEVSNPSGGYTVTIL